MMYSRIETGPGKRSGFLFWCGALFVSALAWPITLRAQEIALDAGQPIRFELRGDTRLHRGRVLGAIDDSLLVRDCADCVRTRYAFSEFTRLDALTHPSSGKGSAAVVGGLGGLLAGALIGGAAGAISDARTKCQGQCGHGLRTGSGMLFFAPIGAVVGAVIGVWRAGDRWTAVLPRSP